MITIRINNELHQLDVTDDMPLLWVLRDILGLTGTKYGCGVAQCGACTIHIDGIPARACQLPVSLIGDRHITTIEAIGNTKEGARRLSPSLERTQSYGIPHQRDPLLEIKLCGLAGIWDGPFGDDGVVIIDEAVSRQRRTASSYWASV